MEAPDYKIEVWLRKQIEMFYDKYTNDKKLAKQKIASLKRYGGILLKFGLYFADMSSDIALLIFVCSAYFTVNSLLPEEPDEAFSFGVVSGFGVTINNLTSDYNKTKELKDQIVTICNVSNIELDKNLDFLDNILRKYVLQLGIVLAASLFSQSVWSYNNFDFMNDKKYPCGWLGKFCWKICSVILCPFIMFYNICQTDLILHDSKREHCNESDESEGNICDTVDGCDTVDDCDSVDGIPKQIFYVPQDMLDGPDHYGRFGVILFKINV